MQRNRPSFAPAYARPLLPRTLLRAPHGEQGYILLVLILFSALIVIGLMRVIPKALVEGQREREEEVIFRGQEYQRAIQAYVRLNHAAMKTISRSGILFTFSCSQAVSRDMFTGAVTAAAIASRRNIRILHHLTQPADHPVSIFHPEGLYLKGLVLHVT